MKNFKISVLATFVLLILSQMGYAQKTEKIKCKYDVNKTDEFTGKIIKTINIPLYYGNIVIAFSKSDAKIKLAMTIKINGSKVESLKTGEEFQFKFENGEILTLTSAKDASPTAQAYATSYTAAIISYYNTEYKLTAADLSKLESMKVTNIKVNVAGQPYQFAVGKSEFPKINKAAYCIQQ